MRMPPRRKTRKTSQARVRFSHIEEPKVETDLKFWLIHALHWHALLLAIVGILVVGVTFF